MKRFLVGAILLQSLYTSVNGQTVTVGSISPAPKDPSATLEVQKIANSKVNIRSGSFKDTSWIQLSNRNNSELGTDFNIIAIKESGLYFNTLSDMASYTNDSLFTMLQMGNIGIGTKSPTAKLDVVGPIRMTDGNQAKGKVLVSDANGVGSWQPKTFGFSALGGFPAISNKQTIPNSVTTALNVINNEEYDGTGMYNPVTGLVTITEAGVYHVDASITYSQASKGLYSLSLGTLPGNLYRVASGSVSSTNFSDDLHLTISTDISLNIGQNIRLFTEQNSGNAQFVFGGFYSFFSMHKVF